MMMKAGHFLVFAHDLAHALQPKLSFVVRQSA
jgi:hypothetical protein